MMDLKDSKGLLLRRWETAKEPHRPLAHHSRREAVTFSSLLPQAFKMLVEVTFSSFLPQAFKVLVEVTFSSLLPQAFKVLVEEEVAA
jgi:hypothetical protein